MTRASSKHASDQRNAVRELGVCSHSFTHLAQVSRETRQAQALEAVNVIATLALVQTGLTGTLVDIFLTVIICESRCAQTLVPVHQVLKKRQRVSLAYHLHKVVTPSIITDKHHVYIYQFDLKMHPEAIITIC